MIPPCKIAVFFFKKVITASMGVPKCAGKDLDVLTKNFYIIKKAQVLLFGLTLSLRNVVILAYIYDYFQMFFVLMELPGISI